MEILLVFGPINEPSQEGTRFLRVLFVGLLISFEDRGRLNNAPIPIRCYVNGSRRDRRGGGSWSGSRGMLLCCQLCDDIREGCDPLSKRGEIGRKIIADTSGPLFFPSIVGKGCSVCVVRVHEVTVFPIRGDDLPVSLID